MRYKMKFTAISTAIADDLRNGAPDANGQPAEHSISDGNGNPCRHCLQQIPSGADMLICAYRPFDEVHPYAETGPIFLCMDACTRGGGNEIPEILTTSPDYLIKGYGRDNRIVYGTGAVVPSSDMADRVKAIFTNADVAYIHARSARNNCYQLRIDRA